MKQLITFNPLFDPIAKTLDFSGLPNFSLDKLYGVINVTRNQPLYAPGAPGLGATQTTDTVITLAFDTSTYAVTDLLNVYYEVRLVEQNAPVELGGQQQQIQETMNQILAEMQLQSWILSEGLNIKREDVTAMRNDLNNPSTI